MTVRKKLVSPRLQKLRQAVETDGPLAMDSFWQELSVHGTPLIEPGTEDDGYSLVTFLWRGDKDTESVTVQITVDGTGQDEHTMSRLLNSNLWYVTFHLRNDYRGAYKYILIKSSDPENAIEEPDPLNPKAFIEPKDEERPDHAEDDIDSVVALPAAPSYTWTTVHPEIQRGNVKRHLFHSHILNNERRIWVYTPPQYSSSVEPYGLLINLDGRFFTFAIRTPVILDNLIGDNQITPLVAVMVDNPGNTWEQSMMIREKELSCYPPFSEFLAQELVPWLRQNYHVTSDPLQTLLAGGSFGGLAATFAALQYSHQFGNVIALSSSFWWKPKDEVEWEWLTRQFALSSLLPVRFYIEVGLLESSPTKSGFPGQVLSNRHLRDVLQAKGYEVYYDEQMHGHDSMTWQGTIAEGLIALVGREWAKD